MSKRTFDFLHLVEYELRGPESAPAPDRRGEMQLAAAVALLERFTIGNVIVTGTHYRCESSGATISDVYAEQLRQRLASRGLAQPRIYAEGEALRRAGRGAGGKDTGGDVRFLAALMHAHGWRSGICLAYRLHLPRIALLLRAYDVPIARDGISAGPLSPGVALVSSSSVLARRGPLPEADPPCSAQAEIDDRDFARMERLKIGFMRLCDGKGLLISALARNMPEGPKRRLQS